MKRTWLAVLAAMTLIGSVGCGDSPTGGNSAIETDPVTVLNAVPTDSGTTWSYALGATIWADELNASQIYATPDDVPPPLSLDEVIALARSQAQSLPHPIEEDSGTLDWGVHSSIALGDTLYCTFDRNEDWAAYKDRE